MTEKKRVSTRVWAQRLRADDDITKVRLCTLVILGTYMDSDGSNAHVRESTLAAAVGIGERAVREHLAYACDRGYLNRVARGHRLGNGETTASTYEATVPDGSTGTQAPVEDGQGRAQPDPGRTSTGRSEGLNRNGDVAQPEPGRSLYKEDQVLLQEQTNLSPVTSAGPAAPVPAPRTDGNGQGEREELIKWIKERHRPGGKTIDSPRAYLRTCEAGGDYPDLVKAMHADKRDAAPKTRPKPPWCGDDACDPNSRLRDTDDGPVTRCPTCHPLTQPEG